MSICQKYEQAFQYLAEYDTGIETENIMQAMSALEKSMSDYEICHTEEESCIEDVLDFSELRDEIEALEKKSKKWQQDFKFILSDGNDIVEEIENIYKASLTNCMYHNDYIYPSTIAANVFCDIISKHVLTDGNKRLAVLVLIWMTQKLELVELSDEWYAATAAVVAKFGNSRREDLVDTLTGMLIE